MRILAPLRQPGDPVTPLTPKELDVIAGRHRGDHGEPEYLVLHSGCDTCLLLTTAQILWQRRAL